ncbi:hypothetical protein PFISCL1PPCAC_6980, partial [Pristionchus fissidentatus]
EKLLEIDAIRVKAPRGLIKGSELVSDTPFRVATTASEDVALSLVPDAPPISISPSISPAGKTFHLLVTDPEKLYANSSFRYELEVVGLITGYTQNIPVEVDVDIKEGEIPHFEKDLYELKVEKSLLKRVEVGIVKLSNSYELADSFAYTLYGSHADRFDFKSRGSVVTLMAVPCDADDVVSSEVCALPATTRLVLEPSSPLRFTHDSYETTLSTGSGTLQPLVAVTTKGGDRSSIIYSLIDKTGLFSLHPTNGLLSIQVFSK